MRPTSALPLRHLRTLAAALALASTLSCAVGGVVSDAPSMPAARAALRPEFRIFYDALVDYGDWVLIEPYGFVFRPKVDFATFHPYADGFWAPSDSWGWVWISAEPFGWATYHYGNWFWDRYQGWVWSPGPNWGPAWVSWQMTDQYAGWAPLGPQGGYGGISGAPDGGYVFAPLQRLGSTDLSAHLATRATLGAAVAAAKPANDLVERDGVQVNRGPSLTQIERLRGGPLARVKIEDVLGAATKVAGGARREETPAADAPAPGAESTRRAGDSAARAARALIGHGGGAPPVLPVLRPTFRAPREPGGKGARHPAAAAPDSSR
ncbi:MAG: hypothetical protein E6K81_12935 [Candidatus Eisenbacteria bacterium]|uniref:DUF3300 domain-containing protein n=1 Tax=Eiseniibacteriota bacterium TaxID=2212470 RepID=A0A538U360_UNCEI|nr:MAG: hypothetical protein E6K81_12935 [Candidatus Eisenbacteria bacterium]